MNEDYVHLMMELMATKYKLASAEKELTQLRYALALAQQAEAEMRRTIDNIYEDCGPR